MLGAAPRTHLCGLFVAVAAATLLVLPADTRAATAPARSWAIELGATQTLQPASLTRLATAGVNAVVAAPGGWTAARHRQLVQLTRSARLRLIEPRVRPAARALRAACRQAASVDDTCAVFVSSSASARAWLRSGTVRYVVLGVASPQAFGRLALAPTSKTRLIAVVGLPAVLPADGSWESAIAAAARGGPDLAVSPGGGLSSPALATYLQKLGKATAAAAQPPPPPDVTPPTAPGNPVELANGLDFFTVGWTASTDDVGVTGYRYFVNGVAAGTTTGTTATVSALVCGTYFTFGVEAYDAAGNHSPRSTVQTSTQYGCFIPGGGGGGGGDTPPALLSAPAGLAQTAATASGVTITWNASTGGAAGYGVYVAGLRVDTTTQTTYTFSGWSCGSTYTVGVDAFGATGNRSPISSLIVGTAPCVDTTPPTAPTNLIELSATATSIAAGWTASTDDVGVTGYRVFVDGALAGTTASPAFTVTGLSCGTSHTIAVDAYDAAGNRSAQASATLNAASCTPPPGDTQPPTSPTGLAVSSSTGTSLALTWTASTDNVGVTGYRVYVNGTPAGTSTAASFTASGLTCGTSYTVAVEAFDAAGNTSGRATLSASTAACTAGPVTHVCSGRSFYVDYATGSDANAGTSQTAPWKRAPGMVGFAGTYSHQAHDCFYFKGGVTWPASTLPWVIPGSGDATANTYYGPAQGWFAGSGWTQPVIDAGGANISSTDDEMVDAGSVDYLTFDNFQLDRFTATRYTGAYGTCEAINAYGAQHDVFDHLTVSNQNVDFASDDAQPCSSIFGSTNPPYQGQSVVQNSVFYGASSTTNSAGGGILCFGNIKNNVMHDLAGMLYPCGHGEIGGNVLYDCGYPSFPTGATNDHADALQIDAANGTFYIHDNVIHDTGADDAHGNECESSFLGNPGETDYYWNNVLYNLRGNAVGLTQNVDGTQGVAAYFWNNTIEGGQDFSGYCFREGHTGKYTTIVIENNHCITDAGRPDDPALSATTKTVDHNATQTPAQASAQGYSPGSSFAYAPAAGSTATIGAGADLSSLCSGALTGLCSSTSYGSALAPAGRPTGAWDIGAYQH